MTRGRAASVFIDHTTAPNMTSSNAASKHRRMSADGRAASSQYFRTSSRVCLDRGALVQLARHGAHAHAVPRSRSDSQATTSGILRYGNRIRVRRHPAPALQGAPGPSLRGSGQAFTAIRVEHGAADRGGVIGNQEQRGARALVVGDDAAQRVCSRPPRR